MKTLPTAKRAQIVYALAEGMSIRGVSRMFSVSTSTVLDLLARVGEACSGYQDENIRGLKSDFIEMDEIHSFIARKGDAIWCWIALDRVSKLRITWHIGDRSARSAQAFCHDLSKRITRGAQLSTDGLAAYRWAVASNMPDNHFAQLVKVYSLDMETVVGANKMPVQGDPDPSFISTSFIEASNLHMRMQNRRYARRTNAHSKILENHCHMIALGFMAYNFVRKHGTIRCTPAQAAGLCENQWTMGDVITMADEWHEANINAKFEQAFMDRTLAPRTHPKSYTPTPKDQLPIPWYLDENGTPPNDERE